MLLSLDTSDIVKEIKDRIQFLATVEIFFLNFLYDYFKIGGIDDLNSKKASLAFALAIVETIVSYVFVDRVNNASRKQMIFLRRTLSLNLILFASIIFVLVYDSYQQLGGLFIWLPVVLLYLIAISSSIAFTVLLTLASKFRPAK